MFLSDDGFDSPEAVNIGGPTLLDGGGLFYTTVAGPAKLYPGTAKFQTDFKAKYGADPKPFAAQGYDSMAICLKAIENAAKEAGNKMPARDGSCQGRARLEGFRRHHRHDQLQRQGRSDDRQVLRDPGHLRRSGQVER